MKNIAVVLRADCALGTGHLMRVKTLLNLILKNENDLFKDDICLYLLATHFDKNLVPLCNEYKDIFVLDEKDIVKKALDLNCTIIIVDHYFLDKKFEIAFKDKAKVIVIDDLANRDHFATLLIDPSLTHTQDDYKNLVNKDCIICAGSDFALIKDEFKDIGLNSDKSYCEKYLKSCLIAFGGADPVHATLKVVRSLIQNNASKLFNFTVLTGKVNTDFDEILKITRNYPNFKVLRHSDDVPSLLTTHRLAIGAYGGMFFERIMAGVPSICTSIADNQDKGIDVMQKYKIGLNLSLSDLNDSNKLINALNYLYTNYKALSFNCSQVYDGKSLIRIKKQFEKLL